MFLSILFVDKTSLTYILYCKYDLQEGKLVTVTPTPMCPEPIVSPSRCVPIPKMSSADVWRLSMCPQPNVSPIVTDVTDGCGSQTGVEAVGFDVTSDAPTAPPGQGTNRNSGIVRQKEKKIRKKNIRLKLGNSFSAK